MDAAAIAGRTVRAVVGIVRGHLAGYDWDGLAEQGALWLTVFCAGSWICLSGVNGPPSLRCGLLLLWCAAVAAAWATRRGDLPPPSRLALFIWVVGGGAGAVLFSGAWRWSWAALALASLLVLLPSLRAWRGRIWLWTLSRQFALVGGLLLLLSPVWTRVHVLPGASQLLWPLLRLTGAQVAVEGQALRLAGYPEAATITPTPQHLALDFAVLIGLGLLLTGIRLRTLGWFVVACVVWLPVRFALLMLVAMQASDANAFYRVGPVAVSLLPLPLVTGWLAGHSGSVPLIQPSPRWATAAVVGVVGICMGSALFFVDPGRYKGNRLLIDESHGPWESTLVPMEDKTLDALSSYNYYWLGRWLRNYYQVQTFRKGPLDDPALANADILMVKTPTQPVQPEEIATIQRFVWRGGGLWIIGDHTDVFGVTTYANPLVEAFGLRFQPDATYDLGYAGLPLCTPPPYPAHPVSRQIRGTYMVHTSCTMTSVGGCAPMVGWGWKQVKGDYSRPHFFPGDLGKKLEFTFGSYALCWTRNYGRGRIVVTADSTIWSNFLTFIPGKPQLALGTLSFLASRNAYSILPRVALAAGGLLALALAVIARRKRALEPDAGVAALACGCLIAGLGWTQVTQRQYPNLPFLSSDPVVCFEGQYSDLFIPVDHYYDNGSRTNRNYHTCFVWAQRVGLVPQHEDTLLRAIRRGRAVVLINPKHDLTATDAAALSEYVRNGGALLLVVGRSRGATDAATIIAANAVLRPCGLSIDAIPAAPRMTIQFGEGDTCVGGVGSVVRGGKPLARLTDQRVVGAVQEVGKGRVVAFTSGSALSTEGLGSPASKMTPAQKACSRLTFVLYRALGLRDDREGAYYEKQPGSQAGP